jgi:hypothetical protein
MRFQEWDVVNAVMAFDFQRGVEFLDCVLTSQERLCPTALVGWLVSSYLLVPIIIKLPTRGQYL